MSCDETSRNTERSFKWMQTGRSWRYIVQADQADFEAFQDKVEQDQQAGLWFKKLHARKKPKNDTKV